MMVFRSDERREYAATTFLKWFTSVENNMKFSIGSGYLPVKKVSATQETLKPFLEKAGDKNPASENLMIGLYTANRYRLYTTKPFQGGDKAREVLQNSMSVKAKEDYEKVNILMNQGISRENAVSDYTTNENFDLWYQDTKKQLETIIGE
jgi:multiple sugar transport system substrate-binding protein